MSGLGESGDSADEISNTTYTHRSRHSSSISNDLERPSTHHTGSKLVQEDSEEDAVHDMATSDMGVEDDNVAHTEPNGQHNTPSPAEDMDEGASRNDSESDEGSRKRKSVIGDEEDYMKMNPELYGLRRSGRARPTRRVVESSDEEEDDDDGVRNGRRAKRQKTTRQPSTRESSPKHPAASSESEEEDDDTYGGLRGKSFAKKHRLTTKSGSNTPNLGEVRFSTRRSAKVATYNEDEYDLSEGDSDATPQQYVYYEEDTRPGIDVVLNYRLKDDADTPDPENPNKHDFEFFIKWQGLSHYHSTWEPWSALNTFKGFRRLENYFRKIVREDLRFTHASDVAIEDREKWNLDREGYLDSLSDYMKVERVIAAREGHEETEYLIKWKGLFYDSCTWEQASLISELAQHEIDRYLDRTSRLPQSNRTEANLATRSDYKPFRTQPAYIKGGQLREFQIHGLNFLAHHWCKGNNVILADEMGLGKTVQTVSFMDWLRHERGQQGPFIVVVPLSTMPAWADTFNNWTPDINYVVYSGNEAARKVIREHELLVDGNPKRVKFNVLLTTYEYILIDSGFLSQLKWQFLAVDEAHRLKNRESQLYAKLMDFGAPSRLLITGTPMQNTLSELSALMDFLMPGKIHVEEDIDLASEHASRKLAELTDAISPYMIRRTKQKVENDLPPKTEKIIRVELSDVQLEYYKNILTRNYAALNAGSKAQKTSLLNIMMELKKASNHPFMFPNAEDRILNGSTSREEQLKGLITSSGKMMLLDRLLTKLKKDNHRVLIFSQMVKMLDILSDYLQLRGHQYQRLDGTIAAGPRRMAIDHFNAPESQDFCFLLSTRAGGLGINLMTADTVVLFDSDWNPQADLQAMARAHRIGQKNPVSIYRLVSKETVEEEVLERARNKLMLEFITIQRGVTDKDALSDRMAHATAKTAEPTSSDDISRILKKRGQKMFEQSGNQRKLEELDIDAVLENAEVHKTEQPEGMTTDGGEEFLRSFEYTDVKLDLEWDDIIPKEQLEKIKEEERKKADAAYLDAMIEENQPRKRKAPVDEAREQRAAKKRARDLAAEAAADMDSDDDSDSGADPKRALSEKECRMLINAYERYGSIEDKQEEILKAARLIGRDIDVVKETLQEVISTAARLLNEEEMRVAELEKAPNKPITKKDRKAVLFDFRGVKRNNAETLTERPQDMRMIREAVERVSDWKTFRVPEASKSAAYTCDWGAREDGMLCVGMARHGFGAWVDIREDAELGLQEKFFLEEHRVANKEDRVKGGDEKSIARSPGAVHLVRRANYLISVLKDKLSNGTNIAAKRALENHHRNNRKHVGSAHGRVSSASQGSASPAPGVQRKLHSSDGNRHRRLDVRSSVDRRAGHGSPNGHRRHERSRQSEDRSRHPEDRVRHPEDRVKHPDEKNKHAGEKRSQHVRQPSTNAGPAPNKSKTEMDPRMEDMLSQISDELKTIHGVTKKNISDDVKRLRMIKTGLIAVGNHISAVMYLKSDQAANQDRLWDYVADRYWPQSKVADKRIDGKKLRDFYLRVMGKTSASTNGPGGPAPEVQQTSVAASSGA